MRGIRKHTNNRSLITIRCSASPLMWENVHFLTILGQSLTVPLPSISHTHNTQITPEKLEELKSRIPRAGPKYRLGMYFETIHDLSEFEDVHEPTEDGYSSYWETETEFESELGNFIFNNVTGDSASVICIDEAMDLLAMREQRQQMQLEMEEARRKATSETVGDNLAKLGPGDLEEYTFNQPADDKRSGGASRHSHHSGSDGTYDGPQPAPIHTTHIVATPLPDEPDSKEDHIYETLDACQDHHFQVYVSKGSTDSHPYSAATFVAGKAATTGNASDDSDKSTSRKNAAAAKSSSFKSVFGKSRHQSLEQATALPRKEKPNLKKKTSLDSHERGAQVAPKQYPGPMKGYGTEKPSPSSPVKRSSQEKINSSSSPTCTTSSHNSVPPSLIIKHKGKTYVIPVVERKREGRSKQGNSSSSKRVHNVICTTAQCNPPPPPPPMSTHPSLPSAIVCTAAPCVGCQATAGPPLPPKKLVTVSQAATEHYDGSRRRKLNQTNTTSVVPSSKHSAAAASNKVTHYGML